VKKSNGTLYFGSSFTTGPLTESDLAGTVTRDFIYFSGKRVARRDAGGIVHYFFSDHLGSSNVVTNATGTTIEEESDFYPFGGERVITDTIANQAYKFTGKERDPESTLDYFGARFYQASIGRFLEADSLLNSGRPWNPQTWNRYPYVLNQPTTFLDPSGLYDFKVQCKVSVTQCRKEQQAFKDALSDIAAQIQMYSNGDLEDQYAAYRLQQVLDSYGTEGDKNGIIVEFGQVSKFGAEATPIFKAGKIAGTNIKFDMKKNVAGSIGFSALVVHEGTHAMDQQNPNYRKWTRYQIEFRAYKNQALYGQLKLKGHEGYLTGNSEILWNSSWGKADWVTHFMRDVAINNEIIQNYPRTVPVAPSDPKLR
jgi:RHS repeat-associated protein